MTVVKTECSPSSIARAFGTLADRLTESAKQATKPGHLAQDIADYEVQAGRLLLWAIDGGLFPKDRSHVNLEWWDRELARIPGRVMTIYGGVPNWAIAEMTCGDVKFKPAIDPDPDAEQRIRADAAKPFAPAQFARCWLYAVGSWLEVKFPERFRHNAASWDWWTAATDSDGRPLGKDGKPLTRRWYWNGERMPEGWKPPFEQDGQARLTPEEQEEVLGNLSDEEMQKLREPDPSADHFELKLEAEIAGTTDFYDDADWMKHQRIRAEVHADACRLMCELVGMGNTLPSDAVHGKAEQLLAEDKEIIDPPEVALDTPSKLAEWIDALRVHSRMRLDAGLQPFRDEAMRRQVVGLAAKYRLGLPETAARSLDDILLWCGNQSAMRDRVKRKVKNKATDDVEGGITVTEAAHLLIQDRPHLTLKSARALVSKAATNGNFTTNGMKWTARRINPDSFSTWRIEQRRRYESRSDDWASGDG